MFHRPNPVNITWGLIRDPQYLEDSCNMESLLDSTLRFLDKETDIELEISKLISEQERNKWTEIPNYDEIDQEISKLIHDFEEEERQQKEQGKPSLVSGASPLMSFLIEESDEELSTASTDLRLGCPDVGKIIDSKDSSSEAMKGENLETDKSQLPELELESELKVARSSEHSGQVSTSDQTAQLQGSSSNVTQSKTEGAPLPLLKLRVSPTPKIVNRLSQLKKRKIRGPSKRLKRKTPKT